MQDKTRKGCRGGAATRRCGLSGVRGPVASFVGRSVRKKEANVTLVIAMDGPSGSGKSSASRGVARALGLRYLDTGAMYRALTWWFMEQEADPGDTALVAARAAEPVIEVSTSPDDPWTRVDGRDVSREIRTP